MVEMAASASASLAARSLAAIVPGAGSWRDEIFGAAPSSVNSVDMLPDSMARQWSLARPGFFRRFTKPQNSHCHSSHKTSLGRRWGNRVNERLTETRLQGGGKASNGQPKARLSLVKILHL